MQKSKELEYIELLAEQYKEVTGIKNVDLKSKAFLSELNEWLSELKRMGQVYTHFLDSNNIDCKESSCVEVGKGEYDSVVKPYSTTVLTDMPISVSKNRIISSNFAVINGLPTIIKSTSSLLFHVPVPKKSFDTYMTQNPYSSELLEDWDEIHNQGHGNIAVGMYGSLNDKNREEKLYLLKSLRSKISPSCIFDSGTLDGNYYAVLSSDKSAKKIKKYFFK